jgi:putative ABC transport system permease protein
MSLLDLTLRNVRRNFRLYTIYLFSMITGVIIHFTFLSLMFNKDILDALRNRQNFETGVNIASAVIFLFIILFVLYANSFFMKQRKKEFGMYLLYGMNERQISLMVFYESMVIGAVSLLVGILLGGLLSKLFGRLLMNLMQYDQVVSLSFPLQAIGSTIAVFLLLAVMITIQSHMMVRRVQLLELFHAKEKMEKPIGANKGLALLSVIMLVVSFVLIAGGRESVQWQEHATASMLTCTVGLLGGTYLFFRQFTGWLLQTITRRKRYHEGNTALWASSIRFQIRSNTMNLTFISLFSTVIILLMCFVAINYAVQFEAVGKNLPNDVAYEARDGAMNEKLGSIIKDSRHSIRYHRTVEALETEPRTPLEAMLEELEYYHPGVLLVEEQRYNEIVELRGDKARVELQGKEAVLLSPGMDFVKPYAPGERPDFTLSAGTDITLSIVEQKDYAFLGWSTNPGTSMDKKPIVFIISDEAFQELKKQGTVKRFELYQIEDAQNAEELSAKLHAVVKETPGVYYSSFADVYSAQIEGSSLLLFSGAFLCLIALFALASVIYFKQLREATDARQQYAILRQIGVDPRDMKSAIRKQLLFVFSLPLVLGLITSWLIIQKYILETLADFPELTGMVWWIMAVYFLIYFLFYLSSSSLYYKIVNQGR